ncbi:sensor histidine kinase [Pseudomonadota bacterium]
MFRTLYAKLSLSLVVLLVTVGVFYTLLSLSTTRYYLQETSQKLNLDLAKNLVADRKLVQDGRINKKALNTTFMEYMVINPSIEIYLLDLQGGILSYSADPGKVKRRSVSLTPINAFLKGEKPPILGDDPRSHDRKKIFSVTPVPSENHSEGYLYVVLQGEQYDDAERLIKESLLWKQTGLALVGSLVLGLVVGLLLFRKLTKRLDTLSTEMDGFRESDFSQYETNKKISRRDDEIDHLDKTFTQMAQRIVEQLDELKQQDQLRRELIANVSHDLRTPVAILHGYLETLDIKSTLLTPEEQQHYIKQAILSSARLNSLITELFDLATLEARESLPNREQFNLSELAHDVVQKFQLKVKEKQISLTMHSQEESIFACGDIGLIERVLENLLGNSVKFTPTTGTIDIFLEEERNKSVIKIKDNGPGIPEKDIGRVFERFYQGDENSNRTKPGGLGLAIAKRIIDLHSGTIEVNSSPGEGTTFCISLPSHQ